MQVVPLSAPLVDATLRFLRRQPYELVHRLVGAIEGEIEALTQAGVAAREPRLVRSAAVHAAPPPPPPPEDPSSEDPLVPMPDPPPPPLGIPELEPAGSVDGGTVR
jgi:hypothetical protein